MNPNEPQPTAPQPTEQPAGKPNDRPVEQPFVQPTSEPAPTINPVTDVTGTPLATPEPSGIGAAPTPPTVSGQSPKDKKKLLLIAAIVGGVLLLAVIAVVVYLAMTNVSKQDYANAASQYNEVSSANTDLTRKVQVLAASTSAGTDEEFAADVKDVEEAITKLKDENKKLGNEKAAKVGEGGKLYDTFDTKLNAYADYAQELVASIKVIRSDFGVCDEVGKATEEAARAKALRECADSFKSTATIPNAEFKAYIDASKPVYEKYAKSYEGVVALTDRFGSNYAQYRTLNAEVLDARLELRKISGTLSTSLNERDKQMSVKDDAKALADYFNEQQRK